MSRLYRAQINIGLPEKKADKDSVANLVNAIKKIWRVDSHYRGPVINGRTTLEIEGEHTLSGGESEEEFGHRLSCLVWNTLGEYAPIELTMFYLEDPPCNYYEFKEDAYRSFTATANTDGDEDE